MAETTKTQYHVIAAQAVAHLEGGKQVYLDRNGLVPENIEPDHLQHLIAVGVVAEVGTSDAKQATARKAAQAKIDAAAVKDDAE